MHRTHLWSLLCLATFACGGDDFQAKDTDPVAGNGGEGGVAGASPAGNAGAAGTAGQPAAGASPGGGSGQGGGSTVPACSGNGFSCDGNKVFVCKSGELALVADCNTNAAKPVCNVSLGACVACSKGETAGCNEDKDALLTCDDKGKPSIKNPCAGKDKFCKDVEGSEEARCVECLKDLDCPTPDRECEPAKCVNNACQKTKATPDTACQSTGFCNGQGVCGECQISSRSCESVSGMKMQHSRGRCSHRGHRFPHLDA